MKFIYEDNTPYFYRYSLLEGIQKDFKELHGDKLFADFMSVRDNLKNPYSDMSYWMKKSSEELEDFISKVEIKKSNSQVRREEKQGAKLVYQTENIKIYFITTYESMKYYGKGTKWCIAGNYPGYARRGQHYFDSYIRDDGIDGGYYVLTDGKNKYCVLTSRKEIHSIWNAEDKSIRLGDLPQEFLEALLDSKIAIGVEEFVIEDGVLKDFHNIYNKTEIKIPSGVTRIDDDIFSDCTELITISIPNSVTHIGDYAFCGCTSLTAIMIPDGVTSIGCEVFYACRGLTSIIIPDNVTSIGDFAFCHCTGLTSVTIGNDVTRIDHGAFKDCINLSDVYYSGSEEDWDNIDIGPHNIYLLDAHIHFNSKN